MNIGRRKFIGLVGAGALSGLAGCGGNNSGGVDESEFEGKVLTQMASLPIQPQLNPYRLQNRGLGMLRKFHALVLPVDRGTGEFLTSGHTQTMGGEEVTVPALIADYSVEGDTATYTVDDRFSYWSGADLTARAFYLQDRLQFLTNIGDPSEEYEGELVSDTEFRRPLPPDLDRSALQGAIHPGDPPLPPAFTEEWVERFADASTSDELDTIYDELLRTELTYTTYAEEGYGTGAYAIEDPETDVARAGLVGHAREDHPADLPVPHLAVQGAGPDTGSNVASSGDVELGNGLVAATGGTLSPSTIPDGFEELARYPSARALGTQIVFNWSNPHLRRLWVRRALAAALPFGRTLSDAYGAARTPPEHDSGMLPIADESALGADFCESLHRYPREADTERAAGWMREAGYTLDGEQWADPNGEPVSLRLLTASTPTLGRLGDSLERTLRDFGIAVDRRTRGSAGGGFSSAIAAGEYDIAAGAVPPGWSPIDQYGRGASVSGGFLLSPTIAAGNNPLDTCADDPQYASVPADVTLPAEPGALRVEGADYADGGRTYVHDGGETVELCAAADSLTEPDIGDEAFVAAARRCARWYNYALPSLVIGAGQTGVWGDTADFTFPEETRPYRSVGYVADDPAHYLAQAGLVR